MHRIPRIAPALIGLAALVALFAATSATGRSQTAPTNSAEPTITYVHPIKIGTILTGNKGTWNGTAPLDYAYQWLRCDDNGLNCQKKTNATGTTYTVVSADADHTIRLDVTASNSDGKATARANATSEIPGNAKAPVETAAPTVSGNAVVGEQLTATRGTWQGTQPISYTIHWQACNAEHHLLRGQRSDGYDLHGREIGRRQAAPREGGRKEQRRPVERPLRYHRGRQGKRRRWRRRRRERRPGQRRRAGRRAARSSTRSSSTRTRSRPEACRSR